MRKKRTFTDIVAKIRDAGLKPTRQRIAIASIIFDGTNKHISAENLYHEIIEKNLKISLATIYNNLHQFSKVNLLREIRIDSSCSYFDTNLSEHHHYYFEQSRRIEDIVIDYATSTIDIPEPKMGRIKSIEVIARVDA